MFYFEVSDLNTSSSFVSSSVNEIIFHFWLTECLNMFSRMSLLSSDKSNHLLVPLELTLPTFSISKSCSSVTSSLNSTRIPLLASRLCLITSTCSSATISPQFIIITLLQMASISCII